MFINVEASRRIGESWKLVFELRGFGRVTEDDYFYFFRQDSHARIELAKYF